MTRSDEFVADAVKWPDELSRRRFLQLMGASIALASTGCTRNPPEHILPYQEQPEEVIPGVPLFYATALTIGGYARGVLVETHEGRPTKIEGNPQHPASLGATDAFVQAELLSLYDPERSHAVTRNGQVTTWDAMIGELLRDSEKWKANSGAGLSLLTRHETSPTCLDQIARLLAKFPRAKWHEYEPLAAVDGAIYHFDKAEVIVSLGADFLCDPQAGVRYARDFAHARRPNGSTMCRLYVLEPTVTLTGSMADHRFAMRPAEIEQFALDLSSRSGSSLAQAIGRDLQRHAGRSLVVAPAALGAVARRLNDSLGNSGTTVDYIGQPAGGRDLRELAEDLRGGVVETLIIIGGNPAYDAPADYEFAQWLGKVPLTLHLGIGDNETSERCQWHAPEKHELEAWSDARAFDGTITIMQPMVEPLFAGHSRHELLSALLQDPRGTDYDIVRTFWQKQYPAADYEAVWRKSLHDGVASFQLPPVTAAAPTGNNPQTTSESGLDLVIRGDARMHDGRYANNAWLHELPRPLTSVVWDNAALVSPRTAARFKLDNGDVVKLKFRGRELKAPIWILPGQADDCVTISLGYGRTRAGKVGNNVGFNASALRTSDAMWGGDNLEIEKTGGTHAFVTTQHHWEMEGREMVRVGTFAEFQRSAEDPAKSSEPPPGKDETLYRNYDYSSGHAWAMVIDLNTCIGCGTCTIACQAENNIPVVGKEQVAMNREMHWIRVDGYRDGNDSQARVLHQPRPCMHCETAPCELVCPVAATVHSSEGLNQMVYNRCIGTRYCSNNCPYKVRRFNFLEYDANQFEAPITRKLMRNPDVSVRSRGVMEKCTYCIQRINAVKIEARKANRSIRDGEVTPACAQACPSDAIVFGDLNDANSQVVRLRNSSLNYGLLAELNTRPRTTYLAKLRNPNPELEKEERER